ncbi:hypothetical protein CPLU01_14222 [Colletotrichum plurivorum]|uniref:Uncharacterized protein n=1 Tax=Colletotrichum plurivorum TaxID=2175906 RepID=A0A8H6MZU4_9PEZI|nr:hypothetical protein CPLU01_14222 [Colletotrichum plurivorum]
MSAPYHPAGQQRPEDQVHTIYETGNLQYMFPSYGEADPTRGVASPPDAVPNASVPLMAGQPTHHSPPATGGSPGNEGPHEKEYMITTQSYHGSSTWGDDRTGLKPKPITNTSWRRYIHGWLLHIPALASTIVIIYISLRKWYWFPEDGMSDTISADVISNVLQFVSKIHELLIVGSLASIAISMTRRRLIGGGIRLGFLTGGYRVGDIEYLLSSPFLRQGAKMPWEVFLVTYLVFTTILSAVIGPASAVLLVPTLGWFRVKPEKAFTTFKMPLYYSMTPALVWPAAFEDALPWIRREQTCQTVDALYFAACPAGGYTEIWNWVQSFASTDLKNNLTFNHPSTTLRRELVFTQSDAQPDVQLLTTPSEFFTTTLGLFHAYVDGQNMSDWSSKSRYSLAARRVNISQHSLEDRIAMPIYQPYVQSNCRVYDKAAVVQDKSDMLYPTDKFNCFGDADCEKVKASPPSITEYYDTADKQFWLDADKNNIQIIGTLYPYGGRSSVIVTEGQVPDFSGSTPRRDILYTCSVFASWVASNYSVDPQASSVLASTLNDEERMKQVFKDPSSAEISVVQFNSSWLDKYLDVPFNVTRTNPADGTTEVRNTTALTQLADLFTQPPGSELSPTGNSINTRQPAQQQALLAKVFGVFLANAASRAGSLEDTYIMQRNETDALDFLELTSQYSSSWDGVVKVRPNGSDAISVTRNDPGNPVPVNQSLAQLLDSTDGWVQLDFDVTRYGYGSGRPRKTLTFSLVMMYIYLAIVGLYAAAVGAGHLIEWTGRGRRYHVLSVRPWDDLQELIVLALRSPVPRDRGMADAGAGPTTHDVWKKRVRAMADENGNVQLVLGEEGAARKLDRTGKLKYF